jgi:alkylation response protein AidB-like acyl-CoA dehydrogenase
MDLAFTPDDEAFRTEVRAFLRSNLPVDLARREARGFAIPRADLADWHRALWRKGWIAPSWPKEHGGPGWTPLRRHLFEVEYSLANAPEVSLIGLSMVGPVICRFGSADLQKLFLEPILSGELLFCQGFSEPQAGSDLASLETTATLDNAEYVINGQKTWTTFAHIADYMICLARTDSTVKPQAGLSMILVPMKSTGVTVRPIASIDGQHHFNEVFLDEVRVPAANLIGQPNRGWSQAKFLLGQERAHNAFVGMLRRYLARIPTFIDAQMQQGLDSAAASELRRKNARLEIDVDALEWSVLRLLASEETPELAAAASAVKIRGSELLLRAGALEVAVFGPQSVPLYEGGERDMPGFVPPSAAPGRMAQYIYWRAASIFGGTTEIQRDIIWRVLARG